MRGSQTPPPLPSARWKVLVSSLLVDQCLKVALAPSHLATKLAPQSVQMAKSFRPL